MFLYLDDGINWVTGDASGGMDGFGGTEAFVGFNFGGPTPGDSTYFAVEGSRTPEVANIETTSNVNVAGLWIFQVNEANIITTDGEYTSSIINNLLSSLLFLMRYSRPIICQCNQFELQQYIFQQYSYI